MLRALLCSVGPGLCYRLRGVVKLVVYGLFPSFKAQRFVRHRQPGVPGRCLVISWLLPYHN